MFFVSLAYTYIYICFILKKKEEMKNMKRDNKARREMKSRIFYICIYARIFFFLLPEKRKKRTKKKNNDGEREGDKFLSTYQKLSSFFFFRQNSFWGQVFMSFFMSLKKVSRRGILLPFFS